MARASLVIRFCWSSWPLKLSCLGLRALGLAALLSDQAGQALVLLVLVDESCLQRGKTVLDRLLLGALKREKLGQLGELAIEAGQHGVLATRLLW